MPLFASAVLDKHKSAISIKLDDIPKGRRNISSVREQLFAILGDTVLHYRTLQELLFHLLKHITPIDEELTLDAEAIEIACTSMLKHLFNMKGKRLVATLVNGKPTKEPKIKSDTTFFCEVVLGLGEAPGPLYSSLLLDVNNDLRSISELIKQYESAPCIKEYLVDNRVPTKHQERTTYEFYKRCITERVEILNYQLNGLKKRALEKAGYMPYVFGGLSFLNMWSDRPYHYALPFSEHYFDSAKISQSRHRVAEISISETGAMQDLYEHDKTAFYEKYFAKIPVGQHFTSIGFHLAHLPAAVGKRRPIFDELAKLFEGQYWIGFYALALPQIEGLFMEMCKIVSATDFSSKGLSAKVKAVRPYHSLSESYFDYYEYYIPLQRNKFAHFGYDENFQLKAYDLLVDLAHLLKMFYELENPYVELTRLHRRRDYSNFVTIEDFSHYFSLLDKLTPAQRSEINSDCQKFENEFLTKECSIEYLCYQMQQELPKRLNDFIWHFARVLDVYNPVDEIFKLSKPELEKFVKDCDTNLLEQLGDAFTMLSEDFEHLKYYHFFIEKSKKHLPSLHKDLKALLHSLKSEFGEDLKNVLALHTLVVKSALY
ncbi:MAG: hypothetical protein ACRYFV_20680 [Janthinobacterium lividum]